ncbi:MAG: glycosyltransferase [Firmicutes bacterium]|nr:glycosyltransferase [Bacillota bacterium]
MDAGKYLFGDSAAFTVVRNAIDVSRFSFSAVQRDRLRMELNIPEDAFVLGHVGRFSEEKNHLFILDVFAELLKGRSDAILLLVGGGPTMEAVREKAKLLSLSDQVIFAGQHQDLGPYYSTMDAMIFPSKFEGLGIVAVEAQCSGLPVLASDAVPREAMVTDRMEFLSFTDPVSKWAERIECSMIHCAENREQYWQLVAESDYHIKKIASRLEEFYLSLE